MLERNPELRHSKALSLLSCFLLFFFFLFLDDYLQGAMNLIPSHFPTISTLISLGPIALRFCLLKRGEGAGCGRIRGGEKGWSHQQRVRALQILYQ